MAEFILTEALKKMIGKEEPILMYKVEEGSIQRYARAVGDSNPMHSDVEYAAQSSFGRLKAPPGFAGWPMSSGFDMFKFVEKLIDAGAPRGNLDGGVEYDFLEPIGAGDTLAMLIRIESIVGKETKLGPTMVTTVSTTYTNQRGAVALIASQTFLSF
jgi:acyl dehydratase